MTNHNGGGDLIFAVTGAYVLVGGVWWLLTGAVFQFVPIAFGVYVTFQVGKALNAK